MMPDKLERVFGRGRLRMTTGEHVEVFREAVADGERRRYTKRFLETGDADFRQWTQREWRILARLIGHGVRCVPDVVQFDGGTQGRLRQVQTYDAGITVDQWATLLPVARDGVAQRHIFEDAAHWWALAHHCLGALDEIHRLQLVHLDIKADNICIPFDPATFDPLAAEATLYPAFGRLALIDFAFSVVSREPLASALPIGWQKDYDYQSPRLLRALEAGATGDLRPTQELDWRCDLYSLAAMLRRYLPAEPWARCEGTHRGWTPRRYEAARALIYALREAHDHEVPQLAPHAALMQITSQELEAPELAVSLAQGWSLATEHDAADVSVLVTPLTRIAAPRHTATPAFPVPLTAITEVPAVFRTTRVRVLPPLTRPDAPTPVAAKHSSLTRTALAASLAAALIAGTIPLVIGDRLDAIGDALRDRAADLRTAFADEKALHERTASMAMEETSPTAQEPAPVAEPDVSMPEDVNVPSSAIPEAVTSSDTAESTAESSAMEAPASSNTFAPPAAAEPTPRSDAVASSSSQRGGTRVDRAAMGGLERLPAPRIKAAPMPPPTHPVTTARAAAPAPRTMPVAPNVDLAAAAKATQKLVAASVTGARQTSSAAGPPIVAAAPTPSATPPATTAATDVAHAPPGTVASTPAEPSATVVAPVAPAAATLPAPEPRRVRVQSATPAAPTEPWRLALHDMMAALNLTQAQAAPVEERNVLSSSAAGPRPAPARQASRGATPTPSATSPAVATPALTPQAPPQAITVARTTAANDDPEHLLNQAHALLRSELPRIAAQAQNDIAPVLWSAAGADAPTQDRAVVTAALARWESERLQMPSASTTERARQLHENAKRAFALGHDRDALELALRAFAANSRDPEIVGFLAHLHLRVHPMQPEVARELALYALASSGSARRVRYDEWNTFAVASALTGRESDASRAMLAELSLTTDVDRSCRAALGAYSMFGERLRGPVQGFMYRVHAQGRDRDSISCRWEGTRAGARYAGGEGRRF